MYFWLSFDILGVLVQSKSFYPAISAVFQPRFYLISCFLRQINRFYIQSHAKNSFQKKPLFPMWKHRHLTVNLDSVPRSSLPRNLETVSSTEYTLTRKKKESIKKREEETRSTWNRLKENSSRSRGKLWRWINNLKNRPTKGIINYIYTHTHIKSHLFPVITINWFCFGIISIFHVTW